MPRLDTGAHQAKRAEHPSSGDHCVLVPTVIASSLGDVPDGDSEIVESSELHTQSPTHGTPAVARARPIEDISRVSYPEGIRHPKAELNVGACRGKYRYDRSFLLQFKEICKERPYNLQSPESLEYLGMKPHVMPYASAAGHKFGGDGKACKGASK
ncbi:hypothetical protein C8Q72DRAFT_786833 [Fomitopsis betulina]|nr:hypothetical protein C8Q72DRAFT_786833 [Fomitopsis betulina]